MKINSDDKASFNDILDDFNHPNPNINKRAYEDMINYFPNQSMDFLLSNLGKVDINQRRKSIHALGAYGSRSLAPVIKVFLSNDDENIRLSCLKVLIKLAASNHLDYQVPEINKIIDIALLYDSPEIILTLISLLRQIGIESLPRLFTLCRDENLLKSKASITAISEFSDPQVRQFLLELLEFDSIDSLIKEAAEQALSLYS